MGWRSGGDQKERGLCSPRTSPSPHPGYTQPSPKLPQPSPSPQPAFPQPPPALTQPHTALPQPHPASPSPPPASPSPHPPPPPSLPSAPAVLLPSTVSPASCHRVARAKVNRLSRVEEVVRAGDLSFHGNHKGLQLPE